MSIVRFLICLLLHGYIVSWMEEIKNDTSVLNRINSPKCIKKLTIPEIERLSMEIRKFLVENVSQTGGHLASNLGVVELTLALHYVFDSPVDKIIWDVGHQSYVHKMITGRLNDFQTLRKFKGLSGFPKCEESIHDVFNTGHSSTSISAALGYARGSKIKGLEGCAVAVIGDGSLGGGMAFEALNDAGHSKMPMIIVLNDNGMSISKNVGGVARYLNKIRNHPFYFHIKDDISAILRRVPFVGKVLEKYLGYIKDTLKRMLIKGVMFESFGLSYLGPVDGHDFRSLTDVLKRAKELEVPTLVHVHTQKGRGFIPAEDSPESFHSVNGNDKELSNTNGLSYSEILCKTLCGIAERNKNIVAITAAMPSGTGLADFRKSFPKSFIDVGIAEQHAVTMSAGLAKSGIIPVCAIYSTFLQRAYDQILHDVCLQKLHVIFAIDRAGCVGSDGETHQGLFDFSYLSHMPNMTIFAPSCGNELTAMLNYAVDEMDSPVAIRYPKDNCQTEREVTDINHAEVIREGTDVVIVSAGVMLEIAIAVSDILKKQGISTGVINARIIKPIDVDTIKSKISPDMLIASIEDNTILGGFGAALENVLDVVVLKFGFPDMPIEHGSIMDIREKYGLTPESIAAYISESK